MVSMGVGQPMLRRAPVPITVTRAAVLSLQRFVPSLAKEHAESLPVMTTQKPTMSFGSRRGAHRVEAALITRRFGPEA